MAHVTGAVVSPGVYTLAIDARVADAVSAAGGALSNADLNALNLAAPVVDGERIEVPFSAFVSLSGGDAPGTPGAPGDAAADALPAASDTSGGLVDLNTAGLAGLESLPEIGPARAQAIIDWRSENGRFENLDALRDVPGIGPETVAAIRGLVTPG